MEVLFNLLQIFFKQSYVITRNILILKYVSMLNRAEQLFTVGFNAFRKFLQVCN
jgi:hypothetical protein